MIALFISLGLLLIVPLLGIVYQQIGTVIDRRRFPPAGRLVRIENGQLHLWEQGSGFPTIVFESGIAASSLSWSRVQPELALSFRTVSYDRAGLGWSARASRPLSLDSLTRQLSSLLAAARIPAPYILVGHSFGAILIHAFADAHPDVIAGLVLVDPVSVEHWKAPASSELKRLQSGAYFSRRGAMLSRLGIVRAALAIAALRHRRLTTTITKVSAGRAASTLNRLVGEIQKLPPSALRVARAEWCLPKCFDSMARHLEILPSSAASAARMNLPTLIPLTILSAATATQAELNERDQWVAGRERAVHQVIPQTGHWLHLERPDVVVEAVRNIAALNGNAARAANTRRRLS